MIANPTSLLVSLSPLEVHDFEMLSFYYINIYTYIYIFSCGINKFIMNRQQRGANQAQSPQIKPSFHEKKTKIQNVAKC
jgi:hypothetical protein